MPNPQNIKPHQFKPGQTGNPNGGSRKTRLTTALIKAIEEKGLDDPFVKVGLQHALKGDFRFWAYIFDRIDGKIPDKLEADVTTSETSVKLVKPDNGRRRDPPASGGAAMGVPGESE